MKHHALFPRQSGFTLVELMVSMVIGMAIVLALMTVTARFESGKRQNGSANALSLNAGYVAYDMDRAARSAGSGYLQSYKQVLGCTLNASRGGQILPSPAAFPAPFSSVPQQVRMIPFLIHAGAGAGGSDVLAVISGTSGVGEAAIGIKPGAAATAQLGLLSTVGLRAQDMLLMIEAGKPCLLTQVASNYVFNSGSSLLALGGSYYAATVNSASVTDYGDGSVLNLGNGADNPPQMTLYGILGSDLVSYDLLRTDGTQNTQLESSGVVDLRALYGIDSDDDGVVDTWVEPTDANYTVGALTDGSQNAQQHLARIRAVRVGMFIRADRIEKSTGNVTKDAISPPTLTMFADLTNDPRYTRTLSDTERLERMRVIEITIPLRNALLLPNKNTLPVAFKLAPQPTP